ncbi:MAG: hypothetical protein WBG50_08140 [Desulfomonilaceae bacterium]
MKSKKENEATTDTIADSYPKLYRDVSAEIVHRMSEVKYELEWLEQHCQEMIRTCASERDLHALVKLKNRLATIAEDLRRESYSLSDPWGLIPLILGEVSQEDLD